MNETLLSFLRRQVGLRTDASSGTGSVHAKVGNLTDLSASNFSALTANVNRTPWAAGKTVYSVNGSNSSTSSVTDQDLFLITGPILILAGYVDMGASSQYVRYKLNTDAVTVFNLDGSTLNGSGGVSTWKASGGNNLSTSHRYYPMFFPNPYQYSYNSGNASYFSTTISAYSIFTFPPLYYCENQCRFSYTSNGTAPNTKWSIFYIRV
ncbi:hypothetical protein GJ688_12730 [Heliobacillus mobilis]|uniref:Uncharacterized protein n=1 Tax=Heliobacterium mobile TaxID=28064 RepID=A0A6I3SNK2_HELMO|nr:hypothetical protein [Heliobacterium mobile]MTV49837.1 hypothetical protein [Heliobacterium mobile]